MSAGWAGSRKKKEIVQYINNSPRWGCTPRAICCHAFYIPDGSSTYGERGEGDGVDRVTGFKKLRLLTIGAAVNTFLFKGIKIKTLIFSAQDKVYMRTRCTKKNWGLALLARSTRKKKYIFFFNSPQHAPASKIK